MNLLSNESGWVYLPSLDIRVQVLQKVILLPTITPVETLDRVWNPPLVSSVYYRAIQDKRSLWFLNLPRRPRTLERPLILFPLVITPVMLLIPASSLSCVSPFPHHTEAHVIPQFVRELRVIPVWQVNHDGSRTSKAIRYCSKQIRSRWDQEVCVNR